MARGFFGFILSFLVLGLMTVDTDANAGVDGKGFIPLVVARRYLLGFKVQPLLRIAGSLLPQISFLGYVGGDDQVAAVGECREHPCHDFQEHAIAS